MGTVLPLGNGLGTITDSCIFDAREPVIYKKTQSCKLSSLLFSQSVFLQLYVFISPDHKKGPPKNAALILFRGAARKRRRQSCASFAAITNRYCRRSG